MTDTATSENLQVATGWAMSSQISGRKIPPNGSVCPTLTQEASLMKVYKIVSLSTALLLILASAAFTGGWSEKVTGGGQVAAGTCVLTITMSAWSNDAGGFSGQMEYSRDQGTCSSAPPVSVHATVECLTLSADGTKAVLAGPIQTVQNDPNGLVQADSWLVLHVLEGGVGSGDRVRALVVTEAVALADCLDGPGTSFPGVVVDGNIKIRER
jgi:hypothetical protein